MKTRNTGAPKARATAKTAQKHEQQNPPRAKAVVKTATKAVTKARLGPGLMRGFAPQHIAIMYRPGTAAAIEQAKELAGWLVEQGFTVYAAPNQELTTDCQQVQPRNLDTLDWVIVLGGDGTYLGAVRMLQGRQTPILGVNMGSLGFLTETRLEDLYKAVISALQGKLELRMRSMLYIQVRRGGKVRSTHIALNDAVLERGSNTHLIAIEVSNQKHPVSQVKADALIVASPTGSTAYNLAAGGPILHPDVRAVVVTPVCPHALTSRPLIFPDDQELSFRVLSKDKRAILTVDGVNAGEVTHEDEVIIVRNALDHYVIRKPAHNYFSLLREKLKFGERD